MTIVQLVRNFTTLKSGDAAVGAFGIVFLIILKNVKDIKLSDDLPYNKTIKKTLFYLSIARNAMIVLITSYFAYLISIHYDQVPFRLSENVDSGIPSFQLPKFNVERANETIGFIEICSELGSGLILLPLVSVLANVAIAKSFSEY